MSRLGGILIILSAMLSMSARSQDDILFDVKSDELIFLGKKYMKSGNLPDAAQTFEIAAERPLSQTKTTAIFLAGTCYYQLGEFERAKKWFSILIEDYPKSSYVQEAKYHKAIILMNSDDNAYRELGLDLMFEIANDPGSGEIRRDAETSLRHHLFNVFDQKLCEVYYQYADASNRMFVLEALCNHLSNSGKQEKIQALINDYVADGGKLSHYLAAFNKGQVTLPKPVAKAARGELRIGIVLPFMLDLMDSATVVPQKSQRAMELYEGMKLAIDSSISAYPKTVIVKAFDSRRDVNAIPGIIEQLESFGPDVVIGDISTQTAKLIAEWAEINGILHFIPLNPEASLVENKQNIFLTHPSIATHGRAMADYMVNGLQKKKIVTFTDGSKIATELYDAYKLQMDSLGATVIRKMVPSKLDQNNEPAISSIVRSLHGSSFDGIYIPISSEEIAGLIISRMNDKYNPIETQVFGSPDWEYFDAIDGEIKTRYQVTFSTQYFEGNDSAKLEELRDTYIYEYGTYPSIFVIEGYDIMKYVLHICSEDISSASLPDAVRTGEAYHCVHQSVAYNGRQDNQKVTIVRYEKGKLLKVWPE